MYRVVTGSVDYDGTRQENGRIEEFEDYDDALERYRGLGIEHPHNLDGSHITIDTGEDEDYEILMCAEVMAEDRGTHYIGQNIDASFDRETEGWWESGWSDGGPTERTWIDDELSFFDFVFGCDNLIGITETHLPWVEFVCDSYVKDTDWLRQAMDLTGLTEQDLADRAGISRQMVTYLRNGQRTGSEDTWRAIVDAIDKRRKEIDRFFS